MPVTLSVEVWGRILCEKGWRGVGTSRDEMGEMVKEPVLAEQMKDVIEYRAMDYYRRRYKEQIKALFTVMEETAYGIRKLCLQERSRLVNINGRIYITVG